jgi:hypothetical protein
MPNRFRKSLHFFRKSLPVDNVKSQSKFDNKNLAEGLRTHAVQLSMSKGCFSSPIAFAQPSKTLRDAKTSARTYFRMTTDSSPNIMLLLFFIDYNFDIFIIIVDNVRFDWHLELLRGLHLVSFPEKQSINNYTPSITFYKN